MGPGRAITSTARKTPRKASDLKTCTATWALGSGDGGGLEVGVEEGQGALAGDRSSVRFEVRALVAVEAVSGVGIEKKRKAGMGLFDFLDFRWRDVFIQGAEMEHDRAARPFGGKS